MKTQGSGFRASMKDAGKNAGQKVQEFKKALERVFSFRKCQEVDSNNLGKYIEPDGQLTSAEESGYVAIDSRMVASDKKNNGQKEFRDNSQRVSSKDSGFSETLDSIIEGDDEVFATQTVESRSQPELGNGNSESAATSTSSRSDDLFAAVEIEDLELDMMEAVDQPPLAKAPLATFDDELEVFSDDNLLPPAVSQVASTQGLDFEKTSIEQKIQRQLAQIFILRTGLSENATVLKDIKMPENGILTSEFVLRAITDRESFVRLCNPYNLIRDAFMDLEQIPEALRLILGEERSRNLRGEDLRDAVWPTFSKSFWVFLDACDAQEKKTKSMPEFQGCDQYFPLELTRVFAKFYMKFGIAEKGLVKHSNKKALNSDERREVLLTLKMLGQLQQQFSELYYHFDQLPDGPMKSVLKALFSDAQVDENGICKSKNVVRIQKAILTLLQCTDSSFDTESEVQLLGEAVDDQSAEDSSVERAFEQLRLGMQEKDPLVFYRSFVSKIVSNVKSGYNMADFYNEFSRPVNEVYGGGREKIRGFYKKVIDDIYESIDPLLGTISLDGLHKIYDTTFDCIWQEIESDLPINNRLNGRGHFYGFKSRKHKAEKENQMMREMAQAEFSILAATMAAKIACKQVDKQNQLRRLGGG